MAKYLGEDAVSQMAALGKYDSAEEKRMFEDADKQDAAYRKRSTKRGGPLEVGMVCCCDG